MRYLNVGCGQRFHPEWTNVDVLPFSPEILRHDIRNGLPFPSDEFEVVYHSHVLEHLPRERAEPFLRECLRVLKPAGILRLAVPDLEAIARLYLQALERAESGGAGGHEEYEWMVLELLDQQTRERSGGAILEHLKQASTENERFIRDRFGTEADRLLREVRSAAPPKSPVLPASLRIRNYLARLFLGSGNFEAFRIGRFRRAGEIHHWMYDRHSLRHLLLQAGFVGAERKSASESAIPQWNRFGLDTEPDGKTSKPDSLFMEAVKPPHSP